MNQTLFMILSGLIAGIFTSMGLGGGSILLIYLVAVLSVDQVTSQGINLIFFIPVAAVSLIFHAKNHYVRWQQAVPAAVAGLIGALIGSYAAHGLDRTVLRGLFALLLITTGSIQLFGRKNKQPPA